MNAPDSIQVTLDLKFLKIAGTWKPTPDERNAAWELYVELVTRVGVISLHDGLLRESLSSFYSLFSSTRDILRKYGPGVAPQKAEGELNFGYLAVAMLNRTLRPLLSMWHPLLADWEARIPATESPLTHELSWNRQHELRYAIEATSRELRGFVDVLAQVCAVPDLLDNEKRGRPQ